MLPLTAQKNKTCFIPSLSSEQPILQRSARVKNTSSALIPPKQRTTVPKQLNKKTTSARYLYIYIYGDSKELSLDEEVWASGKSKRQMSKPNSPQVWLQSLPKAISLGCSALSWSTTLDLWVRSLLPSWWPTPLSINASRPRICRDFLRSTTPTDCAAEFTTPRLPWTSKESRASKTHAQIQNPHLISFAHQTWLTTPCHLETFLGDSSPTPRRPERPPMGVTAVRATDSTLKTTGRAVKASTGSDDEARIRSTAPRQGRPGGGGLGWASQRGFRTTVGERCWFPKGSMVLRSNNWPNPKQMAI